MTILAIDPETAWREAQALGYSVEDCLVNIAAHEVSLRSRVRDYFNWRNGYNAQGKARGRANVRKHIETLRACLAYRDFMLGLGA